MRLAIIFEENLESGGGFQQSLNEVIKIPQNNECEFVIFTTIRENVLFLKEQGFEAIYLNLGLLSKLAIELRKNLLINRFFRKFQIYNKFESALLKLNIDLVYFLGPSSLAFACENMNFIFTIWDTAHRDCLELPEVRSYKEIERREELYTYACRKATAIITDSQKGKDVIVKRYSPEPHRVYVKHFSPSIYLKSCDADFTKLESHKIKPGFLFYPAQLWPHKNHIIILKALKVLKGEGIFLEAVFAGGDKGNKKFLESKIKEFGLDGQVHFLGFISSQELKACYLNCLALIMPTLFGPTNIPPLEAHMFNKPILYTFTDSLKENIGNYELCFAIDWQDSKTIVAAIKDVLKVGKIEQKINIIKGQVVLPRIIDSYKHFKNLYKE